MNYLMVGIIIFLLFILTLNQKVNVLFVFKDFFKTFYNYGNKKTGKKKNFRIVIFDLVSFFFIPILLACVFTLYYKFQVDKELAQVLITTFSLVSTMQFSFLAIIVSQKNDNSNLLRTTIIKETYIALTLSIFLAILNVVILIFLTKGLYLINIQFSSVVILSISFICFVIIFMILKRMYALLNGIFEVK